MTYPRDLRVLARHLLVVAGFGLAIAAPTGVVAALDADRPVHLAQCNGGEEPDSFTTTCVPFISPTTHGASVTAAGGCPVGVSGTECDAGGGATQTTNPQASEAERMAAEAEQIGQDVAEADNT